MQQLSPRGPSRRDGVALIMALALMVIVAGVASLMFARTLSEIRHSADDAAIVQSLMLARGGANLGARVLGQDAKLELNTIVADTSSTTSRWSFGSGDSASTKPDPGSVVTALSVGSGSVAGQFQTAVDDLLCVAPIDLGSGTATVRIFVTNTACAGSSADHLPDGVRLPGGRFVDGSPRSASGVTTDAGSPQIYALPFVMIATGSVGNYKRNVVLQGEYRFTVGRGSFAKYALFTNVHRTAGGYSGSDVWFTDRTLFDGPVHTNQYFRFYRTPWFGGAVTSAGCTNPGATSCSSGAGGSQGAEFYGAGFKSHSSMSPSENNPSYRNSYGTHAPELTAGVDWTADFVPLPSNSLDQAGAAQNDGLYFGGDIGGLELWAADASGNVLTKQADGSWGPAATYQYIQRCEQGSTQWFWNGYRWIQQYVPGACETYRFGADKVLYQQQADDSWAIAQPAFNGVIYIDGEAHRIQGPPRSPSTSTSAADAPPALASFAQMTIAGSGDMHITGDLTYEDQPCSGSPVRNGDGTVTPATCDNLDAANVLGMYAQGGDILIGHNNSDSADNAPRNVQIDAVMMSGTGRVTVEDYDNGSEQGNVKLLGGIIEYYYGAFGTFNANTGQNSTGYGRTFTYDQRMSRGLAPPFFPTVGDDGVKDVRLFSFGQREQVF